MMGVDCMYGQEQSCCYFRGFQSLGPQADDLYLTLRKTGIRNLPFTLYKDLADIICDFRI